MAKWTKVGPALDRLVIAASFHDSYAELFPAAFSNEMRAKSAIEADMAGDVAYLQDACYPKTDG